MKINSISKKMFVDASLLELFSSLTNEGSKSRTALLETADAGTLSQAASGSTASNAKSIIMLSAAAKISAKDGLVKLVAYNDNGQALLQAFQATPAVRAIGKLESSTDKLVISIQSQAAQSNEEARLKQFTSLSFIKILSEMLATGNTQDDETSSLVGTISFDAIDEFEDYPSVQKSVDDYCFYIADELIVQDRETHATEVVVKSFGEQAEKIIHQGLLLEKIIHQVNNLEKSPFNHLEEINNSYQVNISDQEFAKNVELAKKHIIDGDVFQLVLARDFEVSCPEPLTSYAVLREQNPSPYMFYINFGEKILFGASPESCLKVDQQGEALLYPIAGTRARGIKNNQIEQEIDSKIEFELISDEKENAEHMMLLDLARNDLAKVVKVGSRQVSKLKHIAKYSQVMHMVSEVKGRLKNDFDALDAYKACSNMGTLTGAPKIEAVKLIRQFEGEARGLYGGAVCVYSANQVFDSAIIIRSAVVESGVAKISAGAGVVYDSEPQAEALETYNKAKALLKACAYKKVTTNSKVDLAKEVIEL